MRKIVSLLALVLVFTLISCSEKQEKRAVDIPSGLVSVLESVPSDAIGLIYGDKAEKAIAMLDSTSVLRGLELSEFRNCETVVSFCYEGKLMPILGLKLGKKVTDSTAAVLSLVSQADELKMQSMFHRGEDGSSLLVISPSTIQLRAVQRHLAEKKSILNAQHFQDALQSCAEEECFAMMQNNKASRLLPGSFMSDVFSRSSINAFVAGFADWSCFIPRKAESGIIRTTQNATGDSYALFISKLPSAASHVNAILPDTCDFYLSIPLPEEFRGAYEQYLDTKVRLRSYQNTLEGLKTSSKKDPLRWEKEMRVKEVARIEYEDRELVLLRSARKDEQHAAQENNYRGFIPALYGAAFKLADDSHFAYIKPWYIFGSKDDVDAFVLQLEIRETKNTPKPVSCHFTMGYGDLSLTWDKKEFSYGI